ncbi:MAG: isopentenyl-diphosphate delta-isomerase [Candidatus Nealsonbacteria bacterium CG_4_10_14_0_8_um_filter_35_10]|uniref:Isopentenyl-diphosphate delta-isomerase n=2 Tax=Candidatus Nealsoniibacteriota TaxID=1817911 RepID=A0A2M7R820_9BACT|nr:MAG: isopentenyl-diphosphate delta-isomerase [Parcubacteria group bacterium CG1_02_36_42]PIY90795.1 MAG: isopentenyl-diphosphate delta-isomerase [Candidatus Nealsonbacteria bacterium CG_4_10_14_0_8_um_filter_35_10]PJB99728.1 MAG: isopentenyl-diphosphate delta-isomerase [Candidatus Nealsonbacteria bacterium CG_4_9_14_0_8_um_filter_35_12]
MEEVILVNKKDEQIGTGEKLKVHREGKLHRCFSILIFNSEGELLIQQRAKSKYHSPGLWSNTCCSHPRPGEDLKTATKRRLKEEMGIKCDLKEIFSFIYRAKSGKWIEHEFDHVFVGKFDSNPKLNKKEVQDFKWINLQELKKDLKEHPRKYTFWFKRILELYGKEF